MMSDAKPRQEEVAAPPILDCSGEEISEIPDDILFNILLRLPVKLILRFRCVSKSWRSLITSPLFVRTHLKSSSPNKTDDANTEYTRHRQRVLYFGRGELGKKAQLQHCSIYSALHCPEEEEEEEAEIATDLQNFIPEINWDPYRGTVMLIGSCNGLICVVLQPHRDLSPGGSEIFLWNPAIRVSYQLPPHLGFECCHLLQGCMSYGFGYEEASDNYKVVTLFFVYDEDTDRRKALMEPLEWTMIMVHVYSRKTDSWRNIQDIDPGMVPRCDPPGRAVFAKGKLYWQCLDCILSIDLSDETYGRVELPECDDPSVLDGWTVQQLGGCLSVCFKFGSKLCVWIMDDDSHGERDSWTNVCSTRWCLNFYEVAWVDRGINSFTPVYRSKDGEILFTSYYFTAYDPKFDCLTDPKFNPSFFAVVGVGMYVESLVLP